MDNLSNALQNLELAGPAIQTNAASFYLGKMFLYETSSEPDNIEINHTQVQQHIKVHGILTGRGLQGEDGGSNVLRYISTVPHHHTSQRTMT